MMKTNHININNLNINKTYLYKWLWQTILYVLILTACANYTPPYPHKLYRIVQGLSASTPLAVVSDGSYLASTNGKIVELPMKLHSIYDLYENNILVIPAGTAVSATYYNNGTKCMVYWNSIYANGDQFWSPHNAISLKKKTAPTICDPTKNINPGDRLDINFQ